MTFASDINRHTRKYEQNSLLVVRRAVIQMASETVLATPVDKGRARGGWQITFGTPAGQDVGGNDPSGGRVIATIAGKLQGFGPGLWWLSNLVPYIRRLEYGYSKQAPAGMLRIAAARFTQNVDRAARAIVR